MFSAEQDHKIDEMVRELAPAVHEKLATLAAEFTSDEMARRFGSDAAADESLDATQARVYVSMETSLAREMVSRLVLTLINPHATL